MRAETIATETWLSEEERLKSAEQLFDLALARLAKVKELANALIEGYLYRYPTNKWAHDAPEPLRTGAVKFQVNGIKYFIIYSSIDYGESLIDITKNKWPSNYSDPASETIKIQLIPEMGLRRGKTNATFQYQRAEFDREQSSLLTCNTEAETAIRKFILENFPA